MKKIVIILNAVLYNRGSEALVRGLAQTYKEVFPDSQIVLCSSEMEFEEKASIPNVDRYVNKFSYKNKKSLTWILGAVASKGFHDKDLAVKIRCHKMIRETKNADCVIVVGADNYDKTYGMFQFMSNLNNVLRKETRAKRVMFDCSLEKAHIDEFVKEDIGNFDIVTVREQITLSNFSEFIDEKRLYYFPDPAFVMKPEYVELPKGFIEGRMVGINLSDLALRDKYSQNADIIMKSYYRLIEHILQETQYNCVLIPHVMRGADLSVLRKIYDKYKGNGRIVLIEDEKLNAAELKYIISKCELYIGARTHSTIAAYSSCIPTLVVGYSIKSRGIAEDLFGTCDNYVISVKDIVTEETLVEGFKWLNFNKKQIKRDLLDRMPKYQKEFLKIKEFFREL